MRINWLEAICIVAIGVATLQLPVGERGARLFTPPPLSLPVLKDMVVASSATEQHVGENGKERRH